MATTHNTPETPEFEVRVSGNRAHVIIEPNAKVTTSKLDVEARKALPGAKLIFRGETVRDGKARRTVRVYAAK